MTLVNHYTFGDGEHVALGQADLRPRQVASPTNLTEALGFYADHGLPVTPVKPGDKKGYKKGWSIPGHGAALADFRKDDNVGVLNGTQPKDIEGGWCFNDVDIDANSDPARLIVERLLPPTGWRYGRPSKPQSHANYLVKGQLRTRKYFGIDGKVILELRGITQKKTHTLSVAPGSTHKSGEPIRFCEPRGNIGRIEIPDDLDKAVQHAAVGIVILSIWPAENRHRLRVAFAKVLIEHDIPPTRTTEILEAVMHVTGSAVHDVAPAVRSTEDAIRTGQSTAGTSIIIEVLGEETGRAVLACIFRILRSSIVDEAVGIVMRGGQLSAIVDRAEAALLSTPIYQRGGVLTRTIKLATITAVGEPDAVRRVAGSTVLIKVQEPWLLEQMGRTLRWFKSNARNEVSPADPQPIYARTLLSRGEWTFPVLRAVVTAPVLDRDGRIIAEPGFDVSSGLLLDFPSGSFPSVPASPTKDDAHAGLSRLSAPLRAFPFVDDAAKSVALSAMLTALVRVSLRTAPLHGYDAPAAGTGKSLLAEMVGLIATGFRPPALSQGKSPEEDEKRLSTVLFAGDPVIHIDNCELAVTGDFLCSMLTQEVVQARILGLSERRVLPSTALVLASGNNLTLAGDATRRAVICRLDAGLERPDSRAFDFDCHAEVLASRPELVVAGLTILRAYVVAEKPVNLIPMGSFTDYDWIRGALVWLDCSDPADTRNTILDSDPRKDELLSVMDLWEQGLGAEPVEVADVSTRADAVVAEGDSAGQSKRTAVRVLRDKLIEVACRGAWSGKSVGWWLRRNKDRVVGGRSFQCESSRNGQQWRLAKQGAPVQETLSAG
jgi:hypothetical protein